MFLSKQAEIVAKTRIVGSSLNLLLIVEDKIMERTSSASYDRDLSIDQCFSLAEGLRKPESRPFLNIRQETSRETAIVLALVMFSYRTRGLPRFSEPVIAVYDYRAGC